MLWIAQVAEVTTNTTAVGSISTGSATLDSVVTLITGVVIAVGALAPKIRQLVKQLRALILAIEEAGPEAKARAKAAAEAEGVAQPLARSVKKTTQHLDADQLRKHLGGGAALLLCSLLLGCTPSGAIARAERYAQLNEIHAADDSLPEEARQVARDNADAWWVQAWDLGGDEPPAEVKARVAPEEEE